jgi:hypothetical protein
MFELIMPDDMRQALLCSWLPQLLWPVHLAMRPCLQEAPAMLMQQEAGIQQPCRNNRTNVSYAAISARQKQQQAPCQPTCNTTSLQSVEYLLQQALAAPAWSR